MNDELRRVIIAGSGADAWLAAAGLRRALQHRALEVTVVDAGPETAPVGDWTLPSQRGMHKLLGIPESQFVQRTGASFRLASEFRGWQGEGSSFLHAHGDIGTDLEGTPFYRCLLAEAVTGRPIRAEDFSLAALAARQGRFAFPGGSGLTASFTYGYHVPADDYAQLLRAHGQSLGVHMATAPLREVLLDATGDIAAVQLQDGSQLTADLYIDCTGAEARLLGRVADDGREDWSGWLPCDRMLSAPGPQIRDAAAVTQIDAGDAGWNWRAPLAGRSMAGMVYASAFLDDESALRRWRESHAEAGDPRLTNIAQGRRRSFWARNCVALGAAAMQLEPLCGATLHFTQLGLATLVELFPRHRASRVEGAEFNRLMGEQADALRDFTIAHYLASRAQSGAFWNAVRAAAPPARLAHKLDLYSASGRLNLLDHETFEEVDWAWLLIGSGWVPDAVELQIRDIHARTPAQDVNGLRARLQQLVATMPSHSDFLRRQVKA